MALDMTTFDAALKQHYTDAAVENMVYKDNPFLALVSKYENFDGRNLPIPIIYGNPQGRSATFSTAQSNKTNSQLQAFTLVRNKDFSLASIDNETMDASKNNSGAFMEAITTEIDGCINSIRRSLAVALYGTGSGSIGRNTSNATGTTITLTDDQQITNFEVGMHIVFSTADGGGSVKSGSVSVVAVNEDTGVLTVDALTAIAGGSGIAANDYIFVQGDYDSKLKGLSAWIPASAPSSTAFFGVDRSVHPTRLGGIRFDGSAMPIEEALVAGIARVARSGGKTDTIFMNYSNWANLEKALGSKVQYLDLKASAEVGFRGILINGPKGPVKVIPDQNCPSDVAFALQMDTWKLYSLGKAPKVLNSDGLQMLRDVSSNSVEIRYGYYAQLGCKAPGYNARIKLL